MCMHRTLLMSPKGLLSPRREKPTQKSFCSCNLTAGNRRMGSSLLIQLVTVSVPTGCTEQSWSAEEGGSRRARLSAADTNIELSGPKYPPCLPQTSTWGFVCLRGDRSHRKPLIRPHPCSNGPLRVRVKEPTTSYPSHSFPWLIHKNIYFIEQEEKQHHE